MERKTRLKRDYGIAGLNVLLSVIVMLFMIGFIIFIFALIGTELSEEGYKTNTTTFVNLTTESVVNESGAYLAIMNDDARKRSCALTVNQAYNITGNVDLALTTGNYTITGCSIAFASVTATDPGSFNDTEWNITGSFTWEQNDTASDIIYGVTDELSGTTDWFGIIIVLTAMVVLILLTTIIITAIRGSGLIAGGGGGEPRTTA